MGELIPRNAIYLLAMCEITRRHKHLMDSVPLNVKDEYLDFVMRQSKTLKANFNELFLSFMDSSEYDISLNTMKELDLYEMAECGAIYMLDRNTYEKIQHELRGIVNSLAESEVEE